MKTLKYAAFLLITIVFSFSVSAKELTPIQLKRFCVVKGEFAGKMAYDHFQGVSLQEHLDLIKSVYERHKHLEGSYGKYLEQQRVVRDAHRLDDNPKNVNQATTDFAIREFVSCMRRGF